MALSFRHLPILGPKDTTANFEQLQTLLGNLAKIPAPPEDTPTAKAVRQILEEIRGG